MVIIGGSFGGLTTAYELRKHLGRRDCEITLLSKDRRFVFIPSLPWVTIGSRTVERISFDLEKPLARKSIRLVPAKVRRIDPRAQKVFTDQEEEERMDGRICWVVESLPKRAGAWTRRLSWIDAESFLPLKEEHYDAQDELYRVLTAEQVEHVTVGDGEEIRIYPTVMRRTMENVKTGHRTTVTYDSVSYDLGLVDEDFSERRMRRPPRSWIR